jgi:hypothetical protein
MDFNSFDEECVFPFVSTLPPRKKDGVVQGFE